MQCITSYLQRHRSAAASSSDTRGTECMSPERAMQTFMHKLSPFEHHEIFQFPQIYFVGQNAKKKQGVQGGAQNGGYDDEQGSYQLVAHDHIQYRYEVIKIIGEYHTKCATRENSKSRGRF